MDGDEERERERERFTNISPPASTSKGEADEAKGPLRNNFSPSVVAHPTPPRRRSEEERIISQLCANCRDERAPRERKGNYIARM